MSSLRDTTSPSFSFQRTTILHHNYITSTCLYLLLFVILTTQAFEYSAFCEAQCTIGRGGNLCKCNAVHFKGKRTGGGQFMDKGLFASDVLKGESVNNGEDDIMSLLSYIINSSAEKGLSQDEEQLSIEDEKDDYSNRVQKRLLAQMKSPYRKWYKSGLRPFRKA